MESNKCNCCREKSKEAINESEKFLSSVFIQSQKDCGCQKFLVRSSLLVDTADCGKREEEGGRGRSGRRKRKGAGEEEKEKDEEDEEQRWRRESKRRKKSS